MMSHISVKVSRDNITDHCHIYTPANVTQTFREEKNATAKISWSREDPHVWRDFFAAAFSEYPLGFFLSDCTINLTKNATEILKMSLLEIKTVQKIGH
jgi:hypothetical protein